MAVIPLFILQQCFLMRKQKGYILIAINTNVTEVKTFKVRCPDCRGRICDMVIPHNSCAHAYKICIDSKSRSCIIIKCRKCGLVIGLNIRE